MLNYVVTTFYNYSLLLQKRTLRSSLKQKNTAQYLDYYKMLLYLLASFLAVECTLIRPVSSATRDFYVAAVERNWNYAPSGKNKIRGIRLKNDNVR